MFIARTLALRVLLAQAADSSQQGRDYVLARLRSIFTEQPRSNSGDDTQQQQRARALAIAVGGLGQDKGPSSVAVRLRCVQLASCVHPQQDAWHSELATQGVAAASSGDKVNELRERLLRQPCSRR